MKRYLLGAILFGNMVLGMEQGDKAKHDLLLSETRELDSIIHEMPSEKRAESPVSIGQSPTFDQIKTMDEEQIIAYRNQLLEAEGKINPYLESLFNERLEHLAIIKRENVALAAEEKLPLRPLSTKKVQFAEAASDSDRSDIKRPTPPAAADIPAPFRVEHFKNGSDDSDFEERIQSQGDRKTTGSPHLVIEKEPINIVDAVSTPVKEGTDLLAPTPIRQTETFEDDASPSENYKMKILNYATVPPKSATVNKAPDTSGDAALAEKLTEEGKTPGGPDTPQLAVEPIAGADGRAYGAGSGFDSDDDKKTQPEWSAVHQILIAAGVVTALYGGTEVVLAYKSIPEKEWNQTSGFVSKAKLMLGKTWQNIKKRPSQIKNLVQQVPAAGATLFQKLKAKTRAA